MSEDPTSQDEKSPTEAQEQNLADWEFRKQMAHSLYDQGYFKEAADVLWAIAEIPSIDIELAFAARVLAKSSPRKAIRLLTALLEHNRGKAVQNLALANALLHHGMVLQAARFYGAALEADPSLGNPDLEHFLLWTDDQETLWGDFKDRSPKLGELPWMKRDPKEALKLTRRISLHTTPIKLPSLKTAPGEDLKNDFYQQEAKKGAPITPPPAVTIPMDRVDPKHRRFDAEVGAVSDTGTSEPQAAAPAAGVTPPPVPAPILTAAPIQPGSPTRVMPPGAPMRATPPPTIPIGAPAPARPKPTLPPVVRKPDGQ